MSARHPVLSPDFYRRSRVRSRGGMSGLAGLDDQTENVSLPPWYQPPPSAEPFDFSTYLAIPAVGATGLVISFLTPAGRHGVIKKVANVFVGGGFQEGQGNIFWQIRKDQVPVPNYENIVASLGAVSNPVDFAGIRLYEGEQVDLLVNNVAIVVAGQLIGGRLQGWFYPLDAEVDGIWI
jgi:hypothetical protein